MDLGYKFGLLCYILLDLDWKSFGEQFKIRYFTGTGLRNTWTTNLDYSYYILWDFYLDFDFQFIWIYIIFGF